MRNKARAGERVGLSSIIIEDMLDFLALLRGYFNLFMASCGFVVL
jgi:hypothetical protein